MTVRRALLSSVFGDVIELGAGDGKSLPYYPYRSMTSLTLVDRRFSKAVHRHEFGETPVTLLTRLPDTLPFDKCTFDCACLFFALSELAEPYRALSELRRILRPGGRVLFLDHTRPSGPASILFNGVNLLQRVTSRGTVNRNRNIPAMLEVAGFHIVNISSPGGMMVFGEAERI